MALLATSFALLIQSGLPQTNSDPFDSLDEHLPASLTPAEAESLETNPLIVTRGSGPPSSDSIHCPAEYEPMDAILIAWEGQDSWKHILAQMAAHITTDGDADVYVAVDSSSEGNQARADIAAAGADMSRVTTMVVRTDSIWMRDYGPRYIYQGDVRSIVDHTYNRPRPNDNDFPRFFAGFKEQERYDIPLIHGGGNFHLDANDNGFTTRLINNENPGLSEQEIHDLWLDYQNLETDFFDPLPVSVDSTQHIDMWMQLVADDVVMISDWPAQSGSTQDQICDAAAARMAADGYTVFRTPARTASGTHYTYTNVVMCNDLLLLPRYTHSLISQYNSEARATWRQACPGKTIRWVNAESIVVAAGVLHCIVMHVPEHRGGANPVAHVISPNGAEFFTAGDTVLIDWVSDDDVAAQSVDVELSLDGGQTYPTTIASGRAANGSVSWTVPTTSSSRARIRVVAHDGDGNQGSDDSDDTFIIAGSDPLAGLQNYGTGKPGTSGIPTIGASELPILGERISIDLSNALPNGSAILVMGLRSASIPFDGGTVLAWPWLQIPLSIDASGVASLPWRVPGSSGLAGLPLYWQGWVANDPGASGQGWAASDGLEMTLGY